MRSFYLWLAIASLFTLGLSDSGRGPVYPDLLRAFSLTDTVGAAFFFATSFCGFLNNWASGYWLPRLGPYRALQAFLVVQIVGLLVIAAAPGFLVVLIGAGIFGVSLSGLGTVQNITVSQTASLESSRKAFSILHCMYGGASFISPLLISAVYRAGFTWQNAFYILAIFPLFLLIVSAFRKPYRLESAGEPRLRHRFSAGERRNALWVCALVMCYVFAELILSTRIVLYMRRDLGLSIEIANDCLAGFFGLMLIGRIAFAFSNSTLATLLLLRVSAALSLIFFALGLLVHPYLMAVSGLTMAPFFPCLMSYVQEMFGPVGPAGSGSRAREEAAFAWVFTAHAFGIMTMHVLTGWFSDVIGLGRALYFGPVMLGVIIVILAFPVGKIPRAGALP